MNHGIWLNLPIISVFLTQMWHSIIQITCNNSFKPHTTNQNQNWLEYINWFFFHFDCKFNAIYRNHAVILTIYIEYHTLLMQLIVKRKIELNNQNMMSQKIVYLVTKKSKFWRLIQTINDTRYKKKPCLQCLTWNYQIILLIFIISFCSHTSQ